MANVTEPEVYAKRIGDILGDEYVDGKFQPSLDVSSVDEANLKLEKIGQQQEQLNQIKVEIDQNEDYIREGYREASDNVKPPKRGYWAGILAGLFGRRSKDIKRQEQGLDHGQEIALEPFNQVKQEINDLLENLGDAELTLTNYINDNK